ncbi:MAG: TadE/TadG family type IV pilus assembly protein [Rhizomicrobium sp.]
MRELRRLSRDNLGIAAIEFALILPVLLLLYFGGVELTEGVTLNRQVALTATTVATIVSQYTTLSASSQLPDILNAATQILAPYGGASPKVVISLVTIDSGGHATVTWSQSLNTPSRTQGAPITVPPDLDVANTSLVLSEASDAYAPIFDFLGLGPFNLSAVIYMVPREATTINLTS